MVWGFGGELCGSLASVWRPGFLGGSADPSLLPGSLVPSGNRNLCSVPSPELLSAQEPSPAPSPGQAGATASGGALLLSC